MTYKAPNVNPSLFIDQVTNGNQSNNASSSTNEQQPAQYKSSSMLLPQSSAYSYSISGTSLYKKVDISALQPEYQNYGDQQGIQPYMAPSYMDFSSKSSGAEVVLPSPSEVVLSSTDKAVLPSPSEGVLSSTNKAVLPSPSEAVLSSTDKAVLGSPVEAVLSSTDKAVLGSPVEAVLTSPNSAVLASPVEAVLAEPAEALLPLPAVDNINIQKSSSLTYNISPLVGNFDSNIYNSNIRVNKNSGNSSSSSSDSGTYNRNNFDNSNFNSNNSYKKINKKNKYANSPTASNFGLSYFTPNSTLFSSKDSFLAMPHVLKENGVANSVSPAVKSRLDVPRNIYGSLSTYDNSQTNTNNSVDSNSDKYSRFRAVNQESFTVSPTDRQGSSFFYKHVDYNFTRSGNEGNYIDENAESSSGYETKRIPFVQQQTLEEQQEYQSRVEEKEKDKYAVENAKGFIKNFGENNNEFDSSSEKSKISYVPPNIAITPWDNKNDVYNLNKNDDKIRDDDHLDIDVSGNGGYSFKGIYRPPSPSKISMDVNSDNKKILPTVKDNNENEERKREEQQFSGINLNYLSFTDILNANVTPGAPGEYRDTKYPLNVSSDIESEFTENERYAQILNQLMEGKSDTTNVEGQGVGLGAATVLSETGSVNDTASTGVMRGKKKEKKPSQSSSSSRRKSSSSREKKQPDSPVGSIPTNNSPILATPPPPPVPTLPPDYLYTCSLSELPIGPTFSLHTKHDVLKALVERIPYDYLSRDRERRTIPYALICNIILACREIIMSEPFLLQITAPVNICGDIHGQLQDLLNMFAHEPPLQGKYFGCFNTSSRVSSFPSNNTKGEKERTSKRSRNEGGGRNGGVTGDSNAENKEENKAEAPASDSLDDAEKNNSNLYRKYLFMGDYVDRGLNSIEVMVLLMSLKILSPSEIYLLRGNHESSMISRRYGFFAECNQRYPKFPGMWKVFVDFFMCLPVSAIVDGVIFCTHGGISPDLEHVSQLLRSDPRPFEVPSSGVLCDLLWSDPVSDPLIQHGWCSNERGVSYCFGEDVLDIFLERNDLQLVCRGHQVMEAGYGFFPPPPLTYYYPSSSPSSSSFSTTTLSPPYDRLDESAPSGGSSPPSSSAAIARHPRKLVTVFSASNYGGEFGNCGAMMIVEDSLNCRFHVFRHPSAEMREFLYQGVSDELIKEVRLRSLTPRQREGNEDQR